MTVQCCKISRNSLHKFMKFKKAAWKACSCVCGEMVCLDGIYLLCLRGGHICYTHFLVALVCRASYSSLLLFAGRDYFILGTDLKYRHKMW